MAYMSACVWGVLSKVGGMETRMGFPTVERMGKLTEILTGFPTVGRMEKVMVTMTALSRVGKMGELKVLLLVKKMVLPVGQCNHSKDAQHSKLSAHKW